MRIRDCWWIGKKWCVIVMFCITPVRICHIHLNYLSAVYSLHYHGPLARYIKLRVPHAPGMPGTFYPPLRVSEPDMHHGACATNVPWCMPGSLIGVFFWSRWRGKRSRHSRCMCNPQFCASGKRPHSVNQQVRKTRVQLQHKDHLSWYWNYHYGYIFIKGVTLLPYY